MKKVLTITVFMLATLAWAAAQQPATGQATPGSMPPGAAQSQRPAPGSADQNASPGGMPGQAANAPITEGCLGGSASNFTLTDNAGTTYTLNIPPNADTSKLAQHIGESVQVQGNVNESRKGNGSIDVQGIGRGTGKCPAATAVQPPPKP